MSSDADPGRLSAAVDEVLRCQPEVLRGRVVRIPRLAPYLAENPAFGLLSQYGPPSFVDAVRRTLETVDHHGLTLAEGDSPEAIGCLLVDCAADAVSGVAAAAVGRAPARPPLVLRHTASASFVEGASDGPPLLLINAGGVPLRIWAQLLHDRTLGLKVFVPQLPSGPLLEGGLTAAGSIQGDARHCSDLLDELGLHGAFVMSWSNSARTAIEFAAQRPDLVEQLILLCPDFYGIPELAHLATPHVRQMRAMLEGVLNRPGLAPAIAAMVVKQVAAARDASPLDVGEALFSRPAADEAETLVLPMATAESLSHYAARMRADEAYRLVERLSEIRSPCVLISGENDHISAGDLSRAALRRAGRPFDDVEVRYAGHYIFSLQYRYLRHILRWTLTRPSELSAFRLRIAT